MNLLLEWKSFVDFNDPAVLYRVLQLRQQVFIVEQNCIYPDIDDQDQQALHLLAWSDMTKPVLVAYARLFLPTEANAKVSFGRIVVDPAFRGLGLGDQLVEHILSYLQDSPYAQQPIHISAQCYLTQFYQKFGFKPQGEPYDEDGVPHIQMIRS